MPGLFHSSAAKIPGAAEDQDCCDENDQSRIDAHAGKAAVVPDVAPDGEAKAADDDERHDGEIHDRVCRVAAEAPAYVCIRKHVKARVAERGDRVEHAVPQSLSEAELRQEAEKQNERPRPLDCGCAAQNIAHKAHDAAVAVAAEGLCQHHALP